MESGRVRRTAMFLIEPFRALMSPRLYRAVAGMRLRRTLGYLLYVGALVGTAGTVVVGTRGLRGLDEMVRFVAPRFPEMTVGPGGVTTRVPVPYEIRRRDEVLLHLDPRLGDGLPPKAQGPGGRPLITVYRQVAIMSLPFLRRPIRFPLVWVTSDGSSPGEPYLIDRDWLATKYHRTRMVLLVAACSVLSLLTFGLLLTTSVVFATVAWVFARLLRVPIGMKGLISVAGRASAAGLLPVVGVGLGMIPARPIAAMGALSMGVVYLVLGVRWACGPVEAR